MKILLIEPGYLRFKSDYKSVNYISAGLLIIAEVCKKNGYDVEIFLCEQYASHDSLEQYIKRITKKIAAINPDIIGMRTVCDSYPFTLLFCEEIKKALPRLKIVLGGPQATHTDITTMNQYQSIDYIIRGEGESTIINLLNSVDGKCHIEDVKGVTYRKNGSVHRNETAQLCPEIKYNPAYYMLPNSHLKIQDPDNYVIDIELGRGCPYNCVYCCTSTMWERRYRLKTAQSVYSEMCDLNAKYGLHKFSLIHDSFIIDEEKFTHFIEEMCLLNTKHFSWYCSLRIDKIKPSYIEKLKMAGCEGVFFGIESGSSKMQKILNKNIDLEVAKDTIRLLNKRGMQFIASFLGGHPEETIGDIEETIDFAIFCMEQKNCRSIQLHKLTPMNGSKLLEENKNNLIFNNRYIDVLPNLLTSIEEKEVMRHPELYAAFYNFSNIDKEVREIIDKFMDVAALVTIHTKSLKLLHDEYGFKYNDLCSKLSIHSYSSDVLEYLCSRNLNTSTVLEAELAREETNINLFKIKKYRKIYIDLMHQ
jgi:radical SAM superfamily enzyme YgiQ (UPF0313 family)